MEGKTIHELIAELKLQKLDLPFNARRGPFHDFPPHETEVYISEDGETVMAFNRKTKNFALQTDVTCMAGSCTFLNGVRQPSL